MPEIRMRAGLAGGFPGSSQHLMVYVVARGRQQIRQALGWGYPAQRSGFPPAFRRDCRIPGRLTRSLAAEVLSSADMDQLVVDPQDLRWRTKHDHSRAHRRYG
jgi:hypothetical protein